MSGLFTERFQLPVGRWEDVQIKQNLREAQELGGMQVPTRWAVSGSLIWG